MRFIQTLAILIISLLVMLSPAHAEMVVHVVDGDTVDVLMPSGEVETVRLLCVDTPESVHPDRSRNVPMGQVASDYTKRRLYGKKVTLVYEDGNRRGYYGRLLAYILVDGENFNVELVREGLSPYYTKYGRSNEFDAEFEAAEVQARRQGLGVWHGVSYTLGQ